MKYYRKTAYVDYRPSAPFVEVARELEPVFVDGVSVGVHLVLDDQGRATVQHAFKPETWYVVDRDDWLAALQHRRRKLRQRDREDRRRDRGRRHGFPVLRRRAVDDEDMTYFPHEVTYVVRATKTQVVDHLGRRYARATWRELGRRRGDPAHLLATDKGGLREYLGDAVEVDVAAKRAAAGLVNAPAEKPLRARHREALAACADGVTLAGWPRDVVVEVCRELRRRGLIEQSYWRPTAAGRLLVGGGS